MDTHCKSMGSHGSRPKPPQAAWLRGIKRRLRDTSALLETPRHLHGVKSCATLGSERLSPELARLSTFAEPAITTRRSEEAQSRCRSWNSACRDVLAMIESDTRIIHNTFSLNIASLRQYM